MSAPRPCAFCAIVAGDAEAREVWRDDHAVAFLDLRPVFPGHVLVVPPRHAETIVDLRPDETGPLFARVRLLAAAVRDATGAQGTFVAMNNAVSQSVPHLHVHVVPRTKGDGLRGFFWPRVAYRDDAQASEVAAAIAGRAAALGDPDALRFDA